MIATEEGIPEYLKIPQAERNAAWERQPPRKEKRGYDDRSGEAVAPIKPGD